MWRLNVRAAVAWGLLIASCLLLGMAGKSLLPASSPRPAMGAEFHEELRRARGQSELSAMAREVRDASGALEKARDRLAAKQAGLADRLARIEAIDRMLETGHLGESPQFLSEDSTLRALQRILAEAGSAPAGSPEAARAAAAAGIARERIRRRLTDTRDEVAAEVARLRAELEADRDRLRSESGRIESLRRDLVDRLEGRQRPALRPAR